MQSKGLSGVHTSVRACHVGCGVIRRELSLEGEWPQPVMPVVRRSCVAVGRAGPNSRYAHCMHKRQDTSWGQLIMSRALEAECASSDAVCLWHSMIDAFSVCSFVCVCLFGFRLFSKNGADPQRSPVGRQVLSCLQQAWLQLATRNAAWRVRTRQTTRVLPYS